MTSENLKISFGFLVVGIVIFAISIIRYWSILSWSVITLPLGVAILGIVFIVWQMVENRIGINPEQLAANSVKGSAIASISIAAAFIGVGIANLLSNNWREVIGLILALFFALFFLGFGVICLVYTLHMNQLSRNDPIRYMEKIRRQEENARIMEDTRNKLDPVGAQKRQWERRQDEMREETRRWRAEQRKRQQ